MNSSTCLRNRFKQIICLLPVLIASSVLINANAAAQSIRQPKAERSATPGSSNYYPFSKIETVIQKWSPQQHLYVQGQLGLNQSQLMELESWIHQNGPHWTVILMEDSTNQRYTNNEGRIESGMDAVELSMSDLMEVGSYRGQLNPVTGEQDAAVFILFLNERKFSYRASEAQNRRGLGENRWIGKLDRPAYRAMRGGGRILDAVRDTITSINQSVSRAIVQEQKVAEQKRLQRQRSIDTMLSRVSEVENKLAQIETSATAVAKAHPGSNGDLTNPEVTSIRTQVTQIKKSLAKDGAPLNIPKEATDQVENASDDWINLYREYDRFETSEKQLIQRKEQLLDDSGDLRSDLEQSIADVDATLADARTAYDNADSKFQNHLNAATYALENATTQLQTLRTELAQRQSRKSFIRRAIATIGSVFSALFAGLFLWLNRKRAPAKARAAEKLLQREKEVRKEFDGMGDLLERAEIVIGDREAIARKGYQGKTKELSDKALDDIDQILVMSGSVDKVIDGAKEKIEPTSLWSKITNWWSPENFNEGFDLLENKPIEFDRTEGIALAMEDEAGDDPEATGEDKPAKISLSFIELFKIFRERSISANETIGQVETGWTQIVSTNQDLQHAIDEASRHEQASREATETDGLLHVPQLFDELLKSAQEDQDEAERVGKHDPISAIEGPATTGLRKAANADELARQLLFVREGLVPSIRTNTQALSDRDRDIQWVDVALDDFTQRAQQLATAALSEDVSERIGVWRASFENFDAAVQDSVKLHDQSVNEVLPAIENEQAAANEAKAAIAKRLNLSLDQTLTELNNDADRSLQTAREHNAATLASLDRGDPPAAKLSTSEALHWIEKTTDIRTRSLKVLDKLLSDVQSLETQIAAANTRLVNTEDLLKELEDKFTESSLAIEGVNWGIDLSETVDLPDDASVTTITAADLYLLTKRQAEKSQDAANSAKQLYAEGRLLAADDSLEVGRHQIDCCEYNQQLIEERAVTLQQMVEDNVGKLELLRQRFANIERQMAQHFVTTETHAMARKEHQNFSDLKQAIESETIRRDPFNEASAIEAVDGDLGKMISQMDRDEDLYQEAQRSVDSLVRSIEQSNSAVGRSQRDQIPDSRDVKQSLHLLDSAKSDAKSLQSRLKTPHENWQDIDHKADTLLVSVTRSLANLQSELDAAQTAANEIERAASEYQQAQRWSGGYGVRANPGGARSSLDQARSLLNQGEYQPAMQYARQAKQYIMNAIATAETEVMRLQAAERRAAEQRRRAAQQRRMRSNRSIGGGSILGGGGSIFGGGSSSSSRRSSSSSRRSSSSSSSSGRGGFSRSGW